MARKQLPQVKKASELFTDREEPRYAFWQKMKQLEENPGHSDRIAYYGEGGIGKTWLLNQLKNEVVQLKEYQKEGKDFSLISHLDSFQFQGEYLPIYYDLESSIDIVETLCAIRASIFQSHPEFRFPVFDTAIRKYEDLTGKKISLDLKDPENENLGLFERIFDIASVIPGVGSINALYKQFKEPYEVIKDILSRIKDPLIASQIEHVYSRETIEDLRKAIPDYFIADLSDDERDFALVIFIDTFEIFRHNGDQKYNDERILKDYLPLNCDNTLWVYAGRYRIFSDPSIEEHLIGDLSKEDSYLYLKEKQGITDEEIIDKIYEITGGTPIFLDICVSNYRSESYPSADRFKVLDKRELVRRYLQYQGQNEQLIIRLMSTMMHWKDRDFRNLFEKVYGCSWGIYAQAYQNVVETTMIEKISEERRFLHRSVRSAIYDDPAYPKEYKEKALDCLIEMYQEKAADKEDDPLYYEERIIELLHRFKDEKENLSDSRQQALLNIISQSSNTTIAYGLSYIRSYLGVLNDYLKDKPQETRREYSYLLGSLYDQCGEYEKALSLREERLEYVKRNYGEDHPYTINALAGIAISYSRLKRNQEALQLNERLYAKIKENSKIAPNTKAAILTNLSNSYYKEGRYEEALKLSEENLANKIEIYGEDHPSVLLEINNLALNYHKAGNSAHALKLIEEAYEKRKQILGEEHPKTLDSASVMQMIYAQSGNYAKAAEINEDIYDKRKKVLGEDHPDTINALLNLGYDYGKTDNYEKALYYHQQALVQQKQILDPDDPSLIATMRHVAYDQFKVKDYQTSLETYRQILEKVSRIYGEEDLHTAQARFDLASVLNTLKHKEEALALYQQAYECRKKQLGEQHKDTIKILDRIQKIKERM